MKPSMENYAAEAKEILFDRVPSYIQRFSASILEGAETEPLRDELRSVMKRDLRQDLFHLVKRRRIVTPPYRMEFNPATNIYRRREYPLKISDVPKKYLDIETLIPDLEEVVNSTLLSASRLAMELRIKRVTEEASASADTDR